jgi:hypothetical protein
MSKNLKHKILILLIAYNIYVRMKKKFNIIYPYIAAVICSLLILFWVLHLWKANLSVPFV